VMLFRVHRCDKVQFGSDFYHFWPVTSLWRTAKLSWISLTFNRSWLVRFGSFRRGIPIRIDHVRIICWTFQHPHACAVHSRRTKTGETMKMDMGHTIRGKLQFKSHGGRSGRQFERKDLWTVARNAATVPEALFVALHPMLRVAYRHPSTQMTRTSDNNHSISFGFSKMKPIRKVGTFVIIWFRILWNDANSGSQSMIVQHTWRD
jgi:hypothetical protein